MLQKNKTAKYRKNPTMFPKIKLGRRGALIAEGDRLKSLRSHNHIWVVDRITDLSGCPAPHAHLHLEDSPDRVKTLSLDVLLDGEHFCPAV